MNFRNHYGRVSFWIRSVPSKMVCAQNRCSWVECCCRTFSDRYSICDQWNRMRPTERWSNFGSFSIISFVNHSEPMPFDRTVESLMILIAPSVYRYLRLEFERFPHPMAELGLSICTVYWRNKWWPTYQRSHLKFNDKMRRVLQYIVFRWLAIRNDDFVDHVNLSIGYNSFPEWYNGRWNVQFHFSVSLL